MPRARVFVLSLTALLAACGGRDRFAGLDADTIYRMALNEMEEGDWGNAIRALERFNVSFGDDPRIPEVRLLLARSHYEDREYLTARSEYQRFRDRFVAHPRVAEAALGECRSLAALAPVPQRDQTHTQEALTVCGNVVVDYPGRPEAAEAAELRRSLRRTMAEKEYLNGNHYLRRRQYDPAIKYFEFVVDLYPETEFAPRALLGIYRANTAIGYDDLADEARSRLLRDYPDSAEARQLAASTGSGS
jgi:outer membrane protein assembly factor BamD